MFILCSDQPPRWAFNPVIKLELCMDLEMLPEFFHWYSDFNRMFLIWLGLRVWAYSAWTGTGARSSRGSCPGLCLFTKLDDRAYWTILNWNHMIVQCQRVLLHIALGIFQLTLRMLFKHVLNMKVFLDDRRRHFLHNRFDQLLRPVSMFQLPLVLEQWCVAALRFWCPKRLYRLWCTHECGTASEK